jgi:hypothetical protein
MDDASTLLAIWKWNGTQWDGYVPTGPAALNTLKSVNFLDVVWICTSATATLNQPSIAP